MKIKILQASVLAIATVCLTLFTSSGPVERRHHEPSGRPGSRLLPDEVPLEEVPGERVDSPVPSSLPRPPGQPQPIALARPAGPSLDPADRSGLLDALDRGDDRARRWAVFHLVNGFPVDGDVVARLLDLLAQAEDPDLLALALWGLGQSGDPSVVAALGQAALEVPFPEVRLAAVVALASLGGRDATRAIEQVLRVDSATEVRSQAAVALALTAVEDASVVQTLTTTSLEDASAIVRAAAIDGLGVGSSEATTAALLEVSTSSIHAGERERATDLLETRRAIDAADGSDLTALTQQDQDPLVAEAQVSH